VNEDRSPEHLEEKAHEVVEHLQAAALELIEAARAMLDVAEDVVKDPAEVRALAAAAAHLAGAANGPPRANGQRRVQHIRVS
jgi:alkylhydroperoxidase family enzyme